MNPVAPPPHEPEIELLGRVARRFLRVLRAVFFAAGMVAIVVGVRFLCDDTPADAEPIAWFGLVWICAGLPLLLRADWILGRRGWIAALAGAMLWIGPALLPQDHEFGWLIRFFASLVACAVLFVWRTLWRLTPEAGRNGAA